MNALGNKGYTPEEDEAFMLEFYEAYKHYLLHLVGKIVTDPQEQEDLIQDVLIRLMQNVEHLRKLNRGRTATYLFMTVRSAWLDRSRTAQQEEIYLEESEEVEQDAKWDAQILRNQLPSRDWKLLEYKYILGLSDGEIANIMDCVPDSVRTLLRRVRNRAKAILKDREEKGGTQNGRSS